MTETSRFTVIVPHDGSDLSKSAVPAAVALAGRDGEVALVRVIAPTDAAGAVARRTADAGLGQGREELARQTLVDAVAGMPEIADRCSFHVRTGDPAEEILRLGAELSADMIVMASHGRGALERWRFGSVADRVARASSIPVMIVRAGTADGSAPAARFERVVVTYDGSELAAQALPVAGNLGKRLGSPVLVVRAIDPAGDLARETFGAPVPPQVVDEIVQDIQSEAQASVDEAVMRLRSDGLEAKGEVLRGPASPVLLNFAQPGDLIVLTSHGRGGISRWFLGSVAEKLVRIAPAPVVLVPAPGRSGEA